jgi:hypothetical protein
MPAVKGYPKLNPTSGTGDAGIGQAGPIIQPSKGKS